MSFRKLFAFERVFDTLASVLLVSLGAVLAGASAFAGV